MKKMNSILAVLALSTAPVWAEGTGSDVTGDTTGHGYGTGDTTSTTNGINQGAAQDAGKVNTGEMSSLQQMSDMHSDSSQIRQVQQELRNRGYNPGPVDGIFGPRTQAALRNFEQAQGMSADGNLDQATLSALGLGSPDADATDDMSMPAE